MDFDSLDESVLGWIEQRAFESSRLTTETVRGRLTGYLQSYLKKEGGWLDFKDQITEILGSAGLIDRVVDGKTLKPYHVETIFATEAQTAANYGRFTKQIANVDVAPMWEFITVPDDNHVEGTVCYEIHQMGRFVKSAKWEGWEKIYPPNHFRCRSGVVAIPRTVVASEGIRQTPTYEEDGVFYSKNSGIAIKPEEGFNGTAWDWPKQ